MKKLYIIPTSTTYVLKLRDNVMLMTSNGDGTGNGSVSREVGDDGDYARQSTGDLWGQPGEDEANNSGW